MCMQGLRALKSCIKNIDIKRKVYGQTNSIIYDMLIIIYINNL